MAEETSILPTDFTTIFTPSTTLVEGSADDSKIHIHAHRISDTGYTAVALCLSVVWFFGTLFNVTCLAVFLKNKRLRSPTNMFVMALNTSDLCMSTVAFFCMTSSWNKKWLWGEIGCTIEGFMVYFLGLASMYLLCAISFDRYIVIAKPLLGPKITRPVAGAAIGACVLGGAIWAGAPLFGWNEYVLEGAGVSCSVIWETANPVYASYIFTIFFFCLILPLGVMGFSYYHVFMTIRSMSRNQNWDKNSRIAKRNLKVEKKMAKTIAVMLFAFLGCWMPYAVFSFIVVFQGSGAVSPELATYPAIIAKSQGLFNPIIYVATNKQFRMAFYEMLPCSGLSETLKKREEDKPESDESDGEGEETTKKDKGKKSEKKGGKPGRNAVHPAPEMDAESGRGPETVIEDLEPAISHVVPVIKTDAPGRSGGGGGGGGVGGKSEGKDTLEVIELDESAAGPSSKPSE